MDELYLEAKNRIKKNRNLFLENKSKNNGNKKNNYISNLFTRTLLSVILVLISAIYINLSDKNLINFNNHLFNDTLSFTKINNLYTKYFGNILPKQVVTAPVFETNNNYNNITEFNENSYKLALNSNTFQYLESGIVVFIGDKENMGKTIIVQGIDGVDIWYSNIANVNLTLYDYVEKDSIIGEFKDNTAILTFIEDGNYINYEKYLS